MSQIRIPYQTLKLFNDMVARDGGAAFRGWLGKVIPHMSDAYRTDEDGHRSHMGASLLGGECPRAIWYDFRWHTKAKFDGRMLRLFNRGHLEEARFIALILTIGAQVFQQDAQGKQFRISHAHGHVGGSGDGVTLGIPDLAEGVYCLTEFKTHGSKSFTELAGKSWRAHVDNYGRTNAKPFDGKGVRVAKFEHYVQMQLYMYKMGLPIALYLAVNKDTDDIYGELIVLDKETAEQFLDRGEKLVFMDKAPRRICESVGSYKGMFCNHKGVCLQRATPDRNCRSCEFAEPLAEDGAKWKCVKHFTEIDKELMKVGCRDYAVKQVD